MPLSNHREVKQATFSQQEMDAVMNNMYSQEEVNLLKNENNELRHALKCIRYSDHMSEIQEIIDDVLGALEDEEGE